MSVREGVCCECQQVHPIRIAPKDRYDDILEDSFPEVAGVDDGEVGEWVMDTHDAFGSHCDGSGSMPQAILAPNT